MRRKALSLGLAAVLLLCGGTQKNERTAAALVQAAAVSAIQSSTASPESGSITPEQFGARGDGRADDQQALESAMQCASAAGLPLELTEGAVYRFSSQLELPSGLTIRGNGAVLLSDIQYETLGQDRPAVGIIGRSNENRAHPAGKCHLPGGGQLPEQLPVLGDARLQCGSRGLYLRLPA